MQRPRWLDAELDFAGGETDLSRTKETMGEVHHMSAIISVSDLSKTYASGFEALKHVSIDIEQGEILALLGPNGAGKTTLISIICGIVTPTSGRVTVAGHDIVRDYRRARQLIGLVPQEIALDIFTTPWNTVRFSRGLFGKAPDDAHIEKVLRDLSLWDKKASKVIALSGGMKRRVVIAKALAHQPKILFLDEPTAGVDVELRKEMWQLVRELRASGVTVILTTHYIEEAEEMADRVGVIHKGELILVEDKAELMRKMGRKELRIELMDKLETLPAALAQQGLELIDGGDTLRYEYDAEGGRTSIAPVLSALNDAGIRFRDLDTAQRSLEDIFVHLVGEAK
jgi:ABC-2 type transport system ATP-binding protein